MFFFFIFRFDWSSVQIEASSMAVSMIYMHGIFPQIISFNQNTMCGPWVYSYHFTNYVVFPMGVKAIGLMSFLW